MPRKKRARKGLSFSQFLMLLWLVPAIAVMWLWREANLRAQRTWPQIEATRTGAAPVPPAATAPAAPADPTKPVVVPLGVFSGEPSPDASAADLAPVLTEKVSVYENKDWNYGFSMPYGSYWRGFGPRDGAKHSVGISKAGQPADFSSAQVKLWYFPVGTVPPFAPAGLMTQDRATNKTYLRVADSLFVLEAPSFDDPILMKIVATAYLK